MHVSAATALGSLAAVYGVIGALAPAWQSRIILKRKSSRNISLLSTFVFSLGYFIWLAYGLAINNWPLIVVDLIGIVTASTNTYLVYKFRASRETSEE